jgi:hypothetical protein
MAGLHDKKRRADRWPAGLVQLDRTHPLVPLLDKAWVCNSHVPQELVTDAGGDWDGIFDGRITVVGAKDGLALQGNGTTGYELRTPVTDFGLDRPITMLAVFERAGSGTSNTIYGHGNTAATTAYARIYHNGTNVLAAWRSSASITAHVATGPAVASGEVYACAWNITSTVASLNIFYVNGIGYAASGSAMSLGGVTTTHETIAALRRATTNLDFSDDKILFVGRFKDFAPGVDREQVLVEWTRDPTRILRQTNRRIYVGPSAGGGGGAITGSSALTFAAGSSALTATGALAGSAALAFSAGSSTLSASGALTGSAALAFSAGSSALTATGALAGSAALAFAAGSSTVAATGALAGASALGFTAGSSTLAGAGALAASSAVTFTLSGALENDVAGSMSGASAITITPTGTLTGAGALAGASANVFGAGSSAAAGTGALIGSADILFTVAGVLDGLLAGAVDGSAAIMITPTGALTASGALVGAAAMAFSASATIPSTEAEEAQPTGGWVSPRRRRLFGDVALPTKEEVEAQRERLGIIPKKARKAIEKVLERELSSAAADDTALEQAYAEVRTGELQRRAERQLRNELSRTRQKYDAKLPEVLRVILLDGLARRARSEQLATEAQQAKAAADMQEEADVNELLTLWMQM